MRVQEAFEYDHFCFLKVGRARPMGTFATCETCGERLVVDPSVYAAFSQDDSLSIEELCDLTQPNLPRRAAEELERAAGAVTGTFSTDEKVAWMVDALRTIEAEAQARSRQTHIDSRSAWCIGCVAFSVVLLLAPPLFMPVGVVLVFGPMALLLFVGGFVAGAFYLATDVRRYVRRQVIARAVPVLASARPTTAELEAMVGVLRTQRWRVAPFLKGRWFARAIDERLAAQEWGMPSRGGGSGAA
ncbi:MAG: hypothetical protein AAF823_05360 [Planctomycetota bacterium]